MSAEFLDENIDCVPSLGPAFSTDQNLTPEAGFLLSQIDGRTSWKELLLLLPFDRDTVGTLAADLRRREILLWEGGTPPPAVEPPAAPANEAEAAPTPEADDSSSAEDSGDPFGFGVPLPEGAPPPPPAPEPQPAPATSSEAAPVNAEGDTDDELDDDFDEAAEILEALREGGVFDRTAPTTEAAQPSATMEPLQNDNGLSDGAASEGADVDELLDELADIEEIETVEPAPDAEPAGPLQSDDSDSTDAATPDSSDADSTTDVDELLDELADIEEIKTVEPALDAEPAESLQSDGSDSTDAATPDSSEADNIADVDELLEELTDIEEIETVEPALDAEPAEPLQSDDSDSTDAATPDSSEADDIADVDELLEELTDIEEIETVEPTLDAEPAEPLQSDDSDSTDAAMPDSSEADDIADVDELLDELTDIEEIAHEETPVGDDADAVGGDRPRAGQRDATRGRTDNIRDQARPATRPASKGAAPRVTNGARDDRIARLERQLTLQRKLLDRDDPFQALGVKGGADDDEIRNAWHRLSKRFHPDRYYGIDLPPDLAAELDDVYDRLKSMYEQIATRDKRRALMLERKRARLSRARAAEAASEGDITAEKVDGVEAANPERLAELARAALDQRQYGAAINSYRMAHALAPGAGYDRHAKLIELLQKLEARIEKLQDDSEPPLPEDVQAIESTLHKIDAILPDQAALLRNCLNFLVQWSDDIELARSLANRLLKLNRMPDTLTLVSQVYLKANLPRSALDYLEEARKKARDDQKNVIRDLIKEAKRQMK